MMRNIYIAICIFLSVSAWGQEVQILDKADVLQQAVDGVVNDPTFAQAVVGVFYREAPQATEAGLPTIICIHTPS